MDIPVIVHHEGYRDYLKTCIDHNSKFNNIILLGDDENKHLTMNWYHVNEYKDSGRWNELIDVLENYSFYPDSWVRQFYGRLVLIESFLIKNNIEKFVLFDSDILSFSDISGLSVIKNFDAGFVTPEQEYDEMRWVSNIGISFFSREALSDFIDFIIYMYTDGKAELLKKWEWHQVNNKAGGVCEMTLAYLWQRENKKFKIANLAKVYDSGVFDFNLGSATNYKKDEYEFNRILGIKKVVFFNGTPYFFDKHGRKIKVHALHCLGMAKRYMPNLSRERMNFENYCFGVYRICKNIGGLLNKK